MVFKKKIENLQLDLLKNIVNHAYNTVPYYKRLFINNNILPSDINQISDIAKVPILTKQDIKRAGKALISKKYPSIFIRKVTTGGTTGIAANIFRDIFSISNEHAFVLRQRDFAGISINDRCAILTAREIYFPGDYKGRFYVYDPFMKELILSTYHLNYDSAIDYVYLINKYKVKAIIAYPSAIIALTLYLLIRYT
jgi:phenylacetate-CoA ligase